MINKKKQALNKLGVWSVNGLPKLSLTRLAVILPSSASIKPLIDAPRAC